MNPAEPLLTFSRVSEHLARAGRPLAASPDGSFAQTEYAAGDVVSSIALRALRSNAGREWVAIAIPLVPVDRVRLRAALAANDVLPLGAFVDWQGTLLLRQALPLASLTGAQLDQALTSLVHAARLVVVAEDGAPSPLALLFREGAV